MSYNEEIQSIVEYRSSVLEAVEHDAELAMSYGKRVEVLKQNAVRNRELISSIVDKSRIIDVNLTVAENLSIWKRIGEWFSDDDKKREYSIQRLMSQSQAETSEMIFRTAISTHCIYEAVYEQSEILKELGQVSKDNFTVIKARLDRLDALASFLTDHEGDNLVHNYDVLKKTINNVKTMADSFDLKFKQIQNELLEVLQKIDTLNLIIDQSNKHLTELEKNFAYAINRLTILERDLDQVKAKMIKFVTELSSNTSRIAVLEQLFQEVKNKLHKLEQSCSALSENELSIVAAYEKRFQWLEKNVFVRMYLRIVGQKPNFNDVTPKLKTV